MNLRRRIRSVLVLQFATAIGLAILTAALFWNQRSLRRAQQVHFRSYQLAGELRQSSDDLTRLARTFVATGNEVFARQYQAVLGIRNGRLPRPLDYNRVYWDLVTQDRPKPRPDGPAVSLHELMAREEFTAAELAKLASAQKYSDALVRTETIAMNAAKGLFEDGTGNFTVRRPPDRAFAMTLMTNDAYHDNKARVMQPIDEFYVMFAGRTAGDVARFERRAVALIAASGVLIAAMLGLFVYFFATLWKQLLAREQAEAARRESEERYRLIAENTTDVISLYDLAADCYSYVSPSVLPVRGFQPGEMIGRKMEWSLTPEATARARSLLQASLAAAARGDRSRESTAIEVDQICKDGSVVPTEVVASLLLDAAGRPTHVLSVARDISERRRAREALERFNQELEERVALRTDELAARNREIQALLDSIPDTVLLCDASGTMISAHSPPELAGRDRADGTNRNSQEAFWREIARAVQSDPPAGDRTMVREFDRPMNGNVVSFESRATRVGPDRMLILVRDISARKRMEQDVLAHLERERQLSALKSQFITVASHEFRTPLAAAVGSVELLERHAARLPEAKRGELLTRIHVALDRLTSIMDDMVMLSRADSGQMKATRLEVDLGGFVRDVVRNIELADRRQHTFSVQQTGAPGAVPADTNLLHHILSNLLENAVRYSPPGTRIDVALEVGEQTFALTVADDGIGVPAADRERIFEAFVRGSNIGEIGGTGLGLNLAKRYTELMGGRIELLPAERGAAFRVSVPFQQPPA